MSYSDSASQILDIAEVRMRQAGYNAVSYRDIAAQMGIKSASLHYHFPKKEDLGVALVQRYAAAFQERLLKDLSDGDAPRERLSAFVNLYETALLDHQLICLCAVLGAEAQGLPRRVSREVQIFFTQNIEWLTSVFDEMSVSNPDRAAKTALSLLEGSMIISAVNADNSVFKAAADLILSRGFYRND